MKILAIANAHALAHVSRLLEIAKVLRQHGHDVLFAGHGKYLEVASWDGFPTSDLPYISVEQVVKAVRSQRLWELYPQAQIEGFIEAELALYADVNPDLILLDNRPTARTSAENAGLPTVAVLNVHMSNHRRFPFFRLADIVGNERLPGMERADRWENAIECFVYDRLVMPGLNRLRRRFGLPRRYGYEHEGGDISLFADIPEFNPVVRLPAKAQYVGPLTWHNDLPAPACLDRLDTDKPTVYLSLGSEGLEDLISHLDLLAQGGIQIVVATGAAGTQRQEALPEGVYLERYINTDALLPHCDLVCCHGGNGTLYQALGYGLPTVVVATHQEQLYGGKRIKRLKLGAVLTLKEVKSHGVKLVVDAVQKALLNKDYRKNAQSFAERVRGWNAPKKAAAAIEQFMNSG